MPETFEWVPDVARGEWLRPVEAESFDSILSVVPPGFQAYARVFHPVERDRPRGTNTWRGIDERTYSAGVEDIAASLQTEWVTWAKVAASFGTTMHSESQYARLVRCDHDDRGVVIGADGWRYSSPAEGRLDSVSLSAASAVLARHTKTPDAGIAAIWEGWGGLASSAGVAFMASEAGDERPEHHIDEVPARIDVPSLRGRLSAAAQKGIAGVRSWTGSFPRRQWGDQAPGSGLLSHDVAAGERFDLHGGTGRHYFLFEVGANDLADIAWSARAPWVAGRGWVLSPSIVWPDDHAWVLATEIDFDSTLVGGTAELIDELIQKPGLEVLPIRTDADLTWDGDRLNPRV